MATVKRDASRVATRFQLTGDAKHVVQDNGEEGEERVEHGDTDSQKGGCPETGFEGHLDESDEHDRLDPCLSAVDEFQTESCDHGGDQEVCEDEEGLLGDQEVFHGVPVFRGEARLFGDWVGGGGDDGSGDVDENHEKEGEVGLTTVLGQVVGATTLAVGDDRWGRHSERKC